MAQAWVLIFFVGATKLFDAINENKRLRAALEEIAFATDLDEARRTASAALNQQRPVDG